MPAGRANCGAEMSDFGQDHDGIVQRMSKGGGECSR